ncbi:MAG: hypothetical protein FWC41_06185 [Firmicutes bacterium]|nr:hypothetical protein [Bacillota bacterium]
MNKLNIKLLTALLAVAIVAGVCIFYACKKEETLTKETEFVAKNYDGSCVQVNVLRDKNNNAHFITKSIKEDPKITLGLIISSTLKLEPRKAKNEEELVINIPNDAIYWFVPLDGTLPIKFEPIKNGAKADQGSSSGSSSITCTCMEWLVNCTGGERCEKRYYSDGKWRCAPASNSCCTHCQTNIVARVYSDSSEHILVGSVYLIQSDTITIDGITYE